MFHTEHAKQSYNCPIIYTYIHSDWICLFLLHGIQNCQVVTPIITIGTCVIHTLDDVHFDIFYFFVQSLKMTNEIKPFRHANMLTSNAYIVINKLQ